MSIRCSRGLVGCAYVVAAAACTVYPKLARRGERLANAFGVPAAL